MPKTPRWTAVDLLRSKGSHRIYGKGEVPGIVGPINTLGPPVYFATVTGSSTLTVFGGRQILLLHD